MKLFSQNLEQIAIKSICDSSDEGVRAHILSSLDESYFHFEPCKAAYKRIHSIAKKRSLILSFTELVEDPALNEEFRDVLREAEPKTANSESRAKALVASLAEYRKTRMIYTMSKELVEALKQSEVDTEALLNKIVDTVTKARTTSDITQMVYTFGKGGTIDHVSEALSVEDDILYKVGFSEIDNKNGGIPAQGVMIVAATTSGGKSTVLQNMLTNLYRLNRISVANVSLEMNQNKLIRRISSMLTGVPYWKFVKKALSKEERAETDVAWKKLHKFGIKHGIQYDLICPKSSLNITQLLTLLKPYGHKVIGIDYISLLEGVDTDNQWRELSSITRQCKIFSEQNECLIILLAQLDSEADKVRYSKGIVEHADAAWTWNYSKPEQRETKTLPVKQLKARDAELYSFELKEMFEVMTVEDMEGATEAKSDTDQKSNNKSDVSLEDEPEIGFEDAGQV